SVVARINSVCRSDSALLWVETITVTLRGTPEPMFHALMYGSPATTIVSEPTAFVQITSVNGADRNSSILSYTSVVATAIWRLATLVRMANENIEATATRPHSRIPAAIITSIKVNP